ncbi:GNAT family N-acetyltransferase [Mesorhizobium sp. LHD-90]|uniref:GNAT family N-acetyltransferase n=1 Tax=Mesorhizobium sp. LHD-90 TaxID=3071414 RepID=UPI0027E19A3B|nr:GNAT family N-acetyltransferase [Mesorhizobium sp. LHD-90]MDQ6434579.1 GNAT family N-acetyltransferase [Mesorhizobium sp. LHD-90]
MADAVMAAKVPPDAARPAPSSAAEGADTFVSGISRDIIPFYQALDSEGICAPAQSAAWVDAWLAAAAPDSLFAVIREEGRPVFALALEVVRRGPFRVARFMSGTHANGNFALAAPDWLPRLSPQNVRKLASAIGRARPDVDVLMLERLLPDLDGVPNPLLALPHIGSPNLALAVDLAGGFAQVVSGPSGKRKRKKHRTQARKYEAAGGFRRIEAQSVEDVHRLLDAFFGMKTARFRKAGIGNVFAEPQVQAFFRKLFCDALPLSPRPFVLHGLVVGGKLRAVTGSSLCGRRLICEFGSIAEDDMMIASPGEFLFFENIKEACEQGLGVYDFSVGDELYKRLWCDVETRHFDVLAPLTAKGRLFAGSMRLFASLKAGIKHNPTVWRLTKSLRRQTIGKKPPEQTSSDD